jgi:energy-coupling factor transporter ATP-binding protein EcfA2
VKPELLRELSTTARALRSELAAQRFALNAPATGDGLDAPAAAAQTEAMIRQLDDHVIARLDHLDAPALVVVGGSTGSGKSLLVNSLVGADVTKPGVLRPTTMAPALIHDSESAEWFRSTNILPGLARVHDGEARGHSEVRLVINEAVPEGLALLDSPDIDSISVENRTLAAELLAAADLWIFVTTAARYADAVPWEFLARAREQGTPLIIVMNRTPAGSEATLKAHLEEMLAARGLAGTLVFTITEQPLDGTRLPRDAVAPVSGWLQHLGSNRDARAAAIQRSLTGSLDDLARRVGLVASAVDQQLATVETLRTLAYAPYAAAAEQIRIEIGQGALLKGEVLARWEELLGTGELLRQLRTGVARLRDRIAGSLTGRPKRDIPLNGAVEHVVETLIRTRSDEAASKAVAAWRSHPAGVALLASSDSADLLDRSSVSIGERAGVTVRAWQGHVLELIRNIGGDRKSKARILSFGVNGVAMVVMVLVFAHTGGLTGAEVAVASGASAVGHTLLEAVLGDQTVRNLALNARTDLETRINVLLDTEAKRFDDELASIPVDAESPQRLRELARQLRRSTS